MPASKSVQLIREIWLLAETHKEPRESDLTFFLDNMGFDEEELECIKDQFTIELHAYQEGCR